MQGTKSFQLPPDLIDDCTLVLIASIIQTCCFTYKVLQKITRIPAKLRFVPGTQLTTQYSSTLVGPWVPAHPYLIVG